MSVEHDEFVALKAIEKYPATRLEELRQSIIAEAKRTGNMTVAVNYGSEDPIAFVKVERKPVVSSGKYHVTDEKAVQEFEDAHTTTVSDIDFDGLAQLHDDEFEALVDLIALRFPWCVIEVEKFPTFADYDHVGSSVIYRETGEVVPGLEWVSDGALYTYSVKAVEANKSGNPGTKTPKLESVAKAIGGSFAQLTSGELFAIEGEVE